ncbi:hypothetical protein [Actinoallomurus sp. CA-142502]|uniref:hypothetical protein n=1 Tax=Actinoallomurus sp. CA-142502 TaxID=3239885 RepID=UPI003D8F734C
MRSEPMPTLTDYALAIRTEGSPPAPEGVRTVDLVLEEGDVISSTVGAMRSSGLTAADFRSPAIFLAPAGRHGLVTYAGLCGFAGRRIDAYADGVILRFSRLHHDGGPFPDAGEPDEALVWAQVGEPFADGVRCVALGPSQPGLVSPEAATVIRYAERLRMVPPDSSRDSLAMFVLVAALRRRSDDRFPFLSTGEEPVPVTEDDPEQGIDLEKVRQEAVRYRLEQGEDTESGSHHDERIREADAVDIRTLLRRLGSSSDGPDRDEWRCPRPSRHWNGDEDSSMHVYSDNRARCPGCDAEKLGPIRLALDVLGITPDEAASFILDSDRVVDMCAVREDA